MLLKQQAGERVSPLAEEIVPNYEWKIKLLIYNKARRAMSAIQRIL